MVKQFGRVVTLIVVAKLVGPGSIEITATAKR